MRVLAGDIGGTKTALALFEEERELDSGRFPSAARAGLLEIVREFLGDREIDAAVFAVAGPVRDGRSRTTNLPWELDSAELSGALDAPVELLNDFAAVVHGVGELQQEQLQVLAPGEPEPDGPIAVLGAGTGLGEGVGVPVDGALRVLPSEGGHTDLAPRTPVEARLLAYLWKHVAGRVSVERAVSGMGIPLLYDFVVDDGLAEARPEIRDEMAAGDAAAVIAAHGERGTDPACVRALDLFVGLYGAEAGNLALKVLPTGGLYVAGGIAPKLRERLSRGDFLEAMRDKGRMRAVLERIPVALVLEPRVGLLGARARARHLR
ncbi:MAG: glucokinase [Myxococcales bacterium]|jgi:glucokinase